MKIAVASNNGTNVSGHVGRCKSFLIFETNGKEITSKELRENTFTNHGEHHHNHQDGHHHSHQNLIDGLKDCEALIFNHGGWRIIEDLKANNITPILTDEKIAEEAVVKYLRGELKNNEENVCAGHHQ